jgi:2-C-methyl-D-erythritol 4-phosphate cytidylyltransferase
METFAVIVAAGRGERMAAGRPKAFLEVGGETLLVRSARALDAAASVDGIVAVVPAADVEAARRLLEPVAKVSAIVPGGERRQDSVLCGMKAAPAGFEGIVLVHDAARPFVTPALIDALTAEARRSGAAVPVWAVTDTVKRVRDGVIVETVDRGELAAAQTPQAFRLAVLVRAYEAAFRDRVTVTDEAMAVERLGERVAAVDGEAMNRKLTTPDDLVWAEAMLQSPARAAR